MALNKKSFVLYCDLIHTVNKLPDDKAGLLFKHLLAYVNDENPITDDLIVDISFEPIKRQLKRDLNKWEEKLSQKSSAGINSALSKFEQSIINFNTKSLIKYKDKYEDKLSKDNENKYTIGVLNIINERLTKSTNVEECLTESTDNVNVNVTIKESLVPPEGENALYFYIAKSFHTTFYKYKGSKSLENAIVSDWTKVIRLLIENDKVPVTHLIAIKMFLQAGIDKEKGVDTFWSDTIYSISALRKKSKDGVYQIDRIIQATKKWLARNPERDAMVYQAETNLNELING